MFQVDYAGKKFNIYKNIDPATDTVSETGFCRKTNFVAEDVTPVTAEEQQAADQVGGIQNIFKSQIQVNKNLNILSVNQLLVAEGQTALATDMQTFYSANPPFLLIAGFIGLVLAFVCYCQQCFSSCCCNIDPEDFSKYVMCRLVFFVITLLLVLITIVASFFAFRAGGPTVKGVQNVGCTLQSFIYPTIVLGYSDAQAPTALDNSSFCFSILRDSTAYDTAKWQYRGFNPSQVKATLTNCEAIKTEVAAKYDLDKLIMVDTVVMAAVDAQNIEDSIAIFDSYDVDTTKVASINGNVATSYYSGLKALKPAINVLYTSLDPTSSTSIAGRFNSIQGIWTSKVDANFQDAGIANLQAYISDPLTNWTESALAILTSFTTSSGSNSISDSIFIYDTTSGNTPTHSLIPLNNFNWQVVAPSLAQRETETGIKYVMEPTATVLTGQNLTPLLKTVTNCISGSLLVAPLASEFYTTFAAIDLPTMLGGLDPAVEVQALIDQMKSSQETVVSAESSMPSQSMLNFIPIAINSLALVLMLLTALGLVLGFLQCTAIAKCLMNCSWCCSFGLLSISYIMTIVVMFITLFTSQICYTINGITLAPFAYYAINSEASLKTMLAPLAGTCFYGNGQIVSSLIPAEIMDQLDLAFTRVPPSFLRDVGNSSANLNTDMTAKASADFCGYPLFFKAYTVEAESYYSSLSGYTFANDSNTLTVNGNTMTQKQLGMQSLHEVNKFIKANAKYATATDLSASTTEIALDLGALSNLGSNFYDSGNGKMRFVCDSQATNKLFVVSEDCATTDSGVAVKAINDFENVQTYVDALTLNTSTYQLCFDQQTFTDTGLYSSTATLAYPFPSTLATYYSGVIAKRHLGQADKEAAMDWFANRCFNNGTTITNVYPTIAAVPTTALRTYANKQAILDLLLTTRMQSRIQEIMYQYFYYNENADTTNIMNPPGTVKDQLEYPSSPATYTMLSDTRTDLRALGQDTFQYTLEVLPQFQSVYDSFIELKDGINCAIILKKGLGAVLASLCAFDPKNPTLISSLLELSFYQLFITIIVTFGVCCGFCWKRYSLDAYQPTETDYTK